MANLHFKHLDIAWEALDYVLDGYTDEGDDWSDRIEELKKAKIGIEAEMDRRQDRAERAKKKREQRAQTSDLDRLLGEPSHE